jgi:hypothetical protein
MTAGTGDGGKNNNASRLCGDCQPKDAVLDCQNCYGYISKPRFNLKPHPQVAPTFPNARDCEHGHQRGKCPECDLMESEKRACELERELYRAVLKEKTSKERK